MDSNNNSSIKVDVYQIVTDRIIQLLEQGTIPWQQPWNDGGIPMNLLSKRPYRGINLWLLLSLNYERNLFLTWDQIKKIGGSVKRGEHGCVVVWWKKTKVPNGDSLDEQDNGTQKRVSLLRYYKVFNIAQCLDLPENLIEPFVPKEHDPIIECEHIVNTMPQSPLISFKGKEAFYDIQEDEVMLPKMKTFKTSESYYATFFHELVHCTGHEKRLNRKSITEMAEFGSDLYSIEELIAELGSAYLSSYTGIMNENIKNSAAYIGGWLTKLKSDKKFIVHASGFAQRAVDFILDLEPSSNSKDEIE